MDVFIEKKKQQLTLREHDAFCPLTQAWQVNCPLNCPITELCSITLSNYKHDAYSILLVLKLSGWWPVTFKNFVIVLIRIISWSNTKFSELMT